VPAAFTEEGHPYLGDPDAPITIEEYTDYLCPFCKRHFEQTVPGLIEQYVATGQANYLFRDMPLAALHPTAPGGHAAALCVGEQGAASFWEMHDELFRAQSEWGELPDPSGFLADVAEGIGVDMTAYGECVASGRQATRVEESVAAGRAFGFNGTPSFRIIDNESGDAYPLVGAQPLDTFAQWLDKLASGEAPAQAEETPKPPELPEWATAEGLAPDPDRPGFTMAGDPYMGNPQAVLVVVEFSDFQCSSCQRHALDVHPLLEETFVQSGEIMWVFKHLPLREHARAAVASVAAECAADQGQFWEMYESLFEGLDEWSTSDDPDSVLLDLAAELGLDMNLFTTCFNSRQALERVLDDLYDAQGVAQVTPSFIVLSGGQPARLRGARPPDEFVEILQTQLEKAKSAQ
jgi:protein-disulfide isomerase